MIKKISYATFAILLILLVWNYELVAYGIAQGYGQLSIIWSTRSVQEVLKDKSVPDSIKQKIELKSADQVACS